MRDGKRRGRGGGLLPGKLLGKAGAGGQREEEEEEEARRDSTRGGVAGRIARSPESLQEGGPGGLLHAYGHTEASGFHCVCDDGGG